MLKSDVLIIGGGPAGSAAAIRCAQQGLTVRLIEQSAFPRHRPGETLHPGVEPLLKQLGVAEQVLSAGFLRHAGNWVAWDGDPHFVPFGEDNTGPWLGFQAHRAEFDQRLLNQAIALGVEVLQPCRAVEVIVESTGGGDRVVGVVTSAGPMRAKVVIDAAGGRHWLARQLGLEMERRSPKLVARYGYAQGHCDVRDEVPAIVADTKGWTWTAQVRPGLYQWTRLMLEPQRLASDFLPQELAALRPQGHRYAADVTWRKVGGLAGPGYFLAGDAGTVLDPASSHGVLKALMSGMMLGHLLGQLFRRERSEQAAAQGYGEWVTDWFEHDVEKLKLMYQALPQPPAWAAA